MKNCLSCKGSSKSSINPNKPCSFCYGQGYFDVPSEQEIRSLVFKRDGSFRKTFKIQDSVLMDRAYYVWRLANFNGGIDMRMPIVASLRSGSDPFKNHLDILADKIAKEVFGTNMAAANKWVMNGNQNKKTNI